MSSDALDCQILDYLNSDYENIDFLYEEISEEVGKDNGTIALKDLIDSLRRLLDHGYIETYLYYREKHAYMKVSFSEEKMAEYWFRATVRGRKQASALIS